MRIERSLNELKMALEQRKAFKVFAISNGKEDYYDTFMFNEKYNIYQGTFGYLKLEGVIEAINGKLPHLRLEVANE